MQTIPIQPIPSQQFNVILDGNTWDFTIQYTGIVVITLKLNGNLIMSGMRVVANSLIIPYEYLESQSGNFTFLTANFQLPDYTQFGLTQSLVYLNAAELAVLRQPPIYPITTDSFNPIAALPLRFAPQNYTSG